MRLMINRIFVILGGVLVAGLLQVPRSYGLPESLLESERCLKNRCSDCTATRGCGWCAETFTCMNGDQATGPMGTSVGTTANPAVPCASDRWFAWDSPLINDCGNQACRFDQSTTVQFPDKPPAVPKEYDLNCVNGGQRYWNVPRQRGNAYCICPPGWAGAECNHCVNHTTCGGAEGSGVCVKQYLPFQADGLPEQHLSCTCAGPSEAFCNLYSEFDGAARMEINFHRDNRSARFAFTTPANYELPGKMRSGISFVGELTNCELTLDVDCPRNGYYFPSDTPCFEATCHTETLVSPGTGSSPCLVDPENNWRGRGCVPGIDDVEDDVVFHCQYPPDYDPALAGNNSDFRVYCSFVVAGLAPFNFECTTGTCTETQIAAPDTAKELEAPLLTEHQKAGVIVGVVLGFSAVVATYICWNLRVRERESLGAGFHSIGDASDPIRVKPRVEFHAERASGDKQTFSPSAAEPPIARASLSREPVQVDDSDEIKAAEPGAAVRQSEAGNDSSRTMDGLLAAATIESHEDDGLSANDDAKGISSLSEFSVEVRDGVPASPVLSLHGLSLGIRQRRVEGGLSSRTLLSGTSCEIPPSLFALLGPSGSGKTSLLDIVAGRKTLPSTRGSVSHLRGRVRLDGEEMTPHDRKHVCGYILQEDALPAALTVREYLLFIARLRLHTVHRGETVGTELLDDTIESQTRRMPDAEIIERVDKLIVSLGLQNVAGTRIGGEFLRGISGGERRRVSIAVELIGHSAVLLADEPTSGLDSSTAVDVVQALADISKQGRPVIMSIHQPSSQIWKLLDGVILLGRHGRTLYTGSRRQCVPFFESCGFEHPAQDFNPADFLLETLSRMSQDDENRVADAFARHQDVDKNAPVEAILRHRTTRSTPMAIRKHYRHLPPVWVQYVELFYRSAMSTFRNPMLLIFNYAVAIVSGLLTGMVFKDLPFDFYGAQDRLGLLLFAFLLFGITSLSSIGLWREQRLLFLREREASTYNTFAYWAANSMGDIVPIRVLPPFIWSAIVYWQSGLKDTASAFSLFCVAIILVNVISAMICMAVGAAIKSTNLANLVASFALLLATLLCGILSHNRSADNASFVYVLQRASFLNYAFELLAFNEFSGLIFNLSPKLPGGISPPDFPVQGETIILTFGLQLDMVTIDLVILVSMAIFFSAATFAVLVFCVRESR